MISYDILILKNKELIAADKEKDASKEKQIAADKEKDASKERQIAADKEKDAAREKSRLKRGEQPLHR